MSKSFLRDSTTTVVPQLIDLMVAKVAPQLEILPNGNATNTVVMTDQVKVSEAAHHEVVSNIQQFINNIDAGTLGALGTVALIIVVIQLLMTIEQTFNDIWGVSKGRSIWRKVVYYWATITLGPLILLTALVLTGTAEFSAAVTHFVRFPVLGKFLLEATPFIILWIGFGVLYGLMPNTRVAWWAALIGGVIAGTLWQLNSLLNTMYLSRVVTYSKIYGGLGVFPVFLLGMYFSWFIVLFGAQVSFAVQNHRTFLQQRAAERLDQLGRERLACRLVLAVCRQFLHSQPPIGVGELATQLGVPTSLINRLIHRLSLAGLLAETTNDSHGVVPARPPDTIAVTDVLHALRTNGTVAADNQRSDADSVTLLLRELRATECAAPSNLRFSELVARTSP